MAPLLQSAVENRLLRTLAPDDFARLGPHFRRVAVAHLDVLITPAVAIETLYFPESGYGSVVADGAAGRVEIGLIGREGLIGAAPVLLDADRTPHRTLVRQAGVMLGIPAATLRDAVAGSRTLRRVLLRYVHVQGLQVSGTVHSNALYTIEVRLARWLLMCHDRAGGDEIRITHDVLAAMVGVQRASATIAVQTLAGNGLIRAQRGRVTIRDRARLRETADGSYGLAEAEYERLIGTGAADR